MKSLICYLAYVLLILSKTSYKTVPSSNIHMKNIRELSRFLDSIHLEFGFNRKEHAI